MQLPLDFTALIDEVTNIKEAYSTEIAVSVYVDASAPAELIAYVRNAFASTLPTVRFTLTYLDSNFTPKPGDDMAVVVAGLSKKIGPCAAALRAMDVPVMVVTTSPKKLTELLEGSSSAIPEGDLVAPFDAADVEADVAEPIELDEAAREDLGERMGRWVVSVCREKRGAYAVAFPFVRKPLAIDAVQMTSLQNAGIGLIPLIPGADLPILTLNQAKMVLQIAAAYGQEMSMDRVKELIAVVGGAYLCRTLARSLTEFIPILGFAIRAGVAYGGTSVIGHAIIEYYEGGENIAGVSNVVAGASSGGTKAVATLREKAQEIAPQVLDVANRGLPAIRDKLSDSLPKFVDSATDVVNKAFDIR